VTHHEAFLRAIWDEPADDTARLVYADWLEDQGDGDSLERAEFIRGHHALGHLPEGEARRPALLARLDRLLRKRFRDWGGPLARVRTGMGDGSPPLQCRHCMRRGNGLLVVPLLVETFLPQSDLLFRSSFLSDYVRVRLDDNDCLKRQDLVALAQTPDLARVTEVELCGTWDYTNRPALDAADLARLLESPHLGRLTHLDLDTNELKDDSALALARCHRLDRLATLDLGCNHFTAAGAEALLTSPCLPRLGRLNLHGNDIPPDAQADLLARFGARVTFEWPDD
jgi:uncharacterized protein (TIGR02996 family)